MRINLFLFFLLSLTTLGAQTTPDNPRPGACYEKCNAPTEQYKVERTFAVYSGVQPQAKEYIQKRTVYRGHYERSYGSDTCAHKLGLSEKQKALVGCVHYTGGDPLTFHEVTKPRKVDSVIYRTLTVVEERPVPDYPTGFVEVICPKDRPPYLVGRVQELLHRRDLYAGAIDGTLNTATREALVAFQRQEKLPLGGLTVASVRALGIEW